MAKLLEDCKIWISCIQSFKLENINLKNLENIKHDADSNKILFKVILHLSHCADKCHKENLSKEEQIFTIAKTICKNLTDVSDKNKFFSALYYILAYLLKKQAFKEAQIISKYLLPGKIVNIGDFKNSSKYYQVAGLWQTELFKQLDTITSKSETKQISIDEEFISYIMFHFKILDYTEEKYCYSFVAADAYIRKLINIPLNISFSCLEKIFEHLSLYTRNLQNLSIIEAYNMLIIIIGMAFFKRNDAINNSIILDFFLKCDSYFLNAFKNSLLCSKCYQLFREFSLNLFETNFMSKEIGESRFKKSFKILNSLLKEYESNNSVTETIVVISYSFDTIFNKWEDLVSTQLVKTKLTYHNIINMGNFIKCVYRILENRNLPMNYTCKKCSNSADCAVQKDIYAASMLASQYLKVLARVNQDTFNLEIFSMAKDILELMLSAYNKLDKLKCKYSIVVWNALGRLIFNIGLLSETKYPAEMEKLYKVLCSQIVYQDGIEAKLSSFGLENPIGTALHRLNNVYFNQGKYREAMTYTAYNALLSNYDHRKKKACDTWATIKLKQINCKEIQDLTLIKCLKTDAEIVKKLGISINLKNYNLNDLCLRELESLFTVKANFVNTMKKTLDELDARDSSLEYAKGTLLLCFHSLQLNKREYISDYILKAIEKIKFKIKTPSTQYLIANLSFFKVIEKLYKRSQDVEKHLEDANFTIKAFKTLKGNQENTEDDDEDEIIPTYCGINIEEDNKCATELREVLSMWESCMQDNINEIINDWNPKYTLETIVICGEYCRLYKFNVIEIKAWKLAYKLAMATQEYLMCTYITSRSLSIRFISRTWLSTAEQYVESIQNSSSPAEMDIVALFWLSLADFYLDCNKIKEAKALIDKVKLIPNFNIISNQKLYAYAASIQLRNYYALNLEVSQESYCKLIVDIHYSLIHIYESIVEFEAVSCRFWNIKFQLLSHEQMFETLSDVALPMNHLLSYREIYSHLFRGLKCAQKLGISLRIAEFIKFLCYIDLSRSQIDSVETYLQDLEYILCLDRFQSPRKVKLPEKPVQLDKMKLIQTIRDSSVTPIILPKNNASPELKKKPHLFPDFIKHTTYCHCFYCTNLQYQYLIYSYCHMQAQLYTLLKRTVDAEHFFHEAYKIKLRSDELFTDSTRQYKDYNWKMQQKYIIDNLLYLLDFSMYITEFKPDQKDSALDLIEEALEIAKINDLSKHCVCCYAMELYAQHHVYEILHNLDISVPCDIPIDITSQQPDKCITPNVQIEKATRNVRRHKSPQPIAIPVITVSSENCDENNSGNSPVPTIAINGAVKTYGREKKPLRTSTRNVRRKILTDEAEENPTATEKEEAPKKRSVRLAKKSTGSSAN